MFKMLCDYKNILIKCAGAVKERLIFGNGISLCNAHNDMHDKIVYLFSNGYTYSKIRLMSDKEIEKAYLTLKVSGLGKGEPG